MSEAVLIAERRTEKGSAAAGRIRREGRVPAVVYGLGAENLTVTVPARDLMHILTGGTGANTLITLRCDGAEDLALARQIQRHPLKGTLLHVDFVRVRADEVIAAEVPLHLTGDPEGVKMGGMMEQLIFSISVEALPTNLPPAIEYDVAAMEIGDQVHVRDLRPPAGVALTNDPDELVAQVTQPRGMDLGEEPVAEGEGEGVEGAEGEGGAAGESGGGESGDGEG